MFNRHKSKRLIFLNSIESIQESKFYRLEDDQIRHFKKVLRIEWGESVNVTDGNGNLYEATLEQDASRGGVTIHKKLKSESKPQEIRIHLGFAKNSTMDFVAEKSAECGASSIQAVITSRSVVRPKKSETDKYIHRWQRLANEACEQSERLFQMKVFEPLEWNQWLTQQSKNLSQAARIVFVSEMRNESTHADLIKNSIRDLAIVKNKPIDILFGPEGGFSEEEMNAITDIGFKACSLGSKVYQVETAVVVGVTLVQFSSLI